MVLTPSPLKLTAVGLSFLSDPLDGINYTIIFFRVSYSAIKPSKTPAQRGPRPRWVCNPDLDDGEGDGARSLLTADGTVENPRFRVTEAPKVSLHLVKSSPLGVQPTYPIGCIVIFHTILITQLDHWLRPSNNHELF